MKKLIIEIFKSPREEGLYLYVEKAKGLVDVPEALLEKFGTPKAAMTMLLDEERKLVKADSKKVLAAIESNGYYLQLPSPKEAYMQEINHHNSKLF